MAVGARVFWGAEEMAAELHGTNRSSSAINWTHTPFFIPSSSKLRLRHYSLKWNIAQADLCRGIPQQVQELRTLSVGELRQSPARCRVRG